jgi:crossover junction endodeoxyribonuclease RuvC
MATSCVLGIDPGAQGAIAVLTSSGELIEVYDMPWTQEPNGRKITNAPLLAEIIAKSQAGRIFCEFVASRPTDGVMQAFSFGRCRGVIEGIAGAYDLPIIFLTPPVWKRHAGVPPGKENKDVARTKAIARWPAHAGRFAHKTNIDRAEASLIGDCGLHREVAPC